MIYVAELDDAEFTQLGDTLVSGFVLEKELEQAHLFTAEKRHFVSLLAGFFFVHPGPIQYFSDLLRQTFGDD